MSLLYLRSNCFSLLYCFFVLLFKFKHIILLLVYVALQQLYSILHKLILGKTLITNSTVYLYSSLIVSLVGVFGGGITELLPFFYLADPPDAKIFAQFKTYDIVFPTEDDFGRSPYAKINHETLYTWGLS